MFRVAASVMRLPSTICCGMLRSAASFVASLPPPCTNSFLPLIREKAERKESSLAASSMMLPPTLMIYSVSFICFEAYLKELPEQPIPGWRPPV